MMELILEHSDVKVVVHTTRAATNDTANTDAATNDAPAGEDLVEVGGMGTPGTTFVRRDWLDNAGTTDPERELTCDSDTGALVHGDVPAAFARGQDRARRAHRARERRGAPPAGDVIADSYRVPDPMARLVRLRDGSCRFPGCSTPARQCDLDHVRAWPLGLTTPTNLVALCRRHHRIKQRHGWTVTLHPDATVTWTDPTGLQRTTWRVDHLHLITAGHTTSAHATTNPADIPSTFEDQLIELLDGSTHARPRTYPTGFDINGNTTGGPPHGIDLDHSPGWNRYLIDFPPQPTRPPQPIPF